jgi:hypothetical protein
MSKYMKSEIPEFRTSLLTRCYVSARMLGICIDNASYKDNAGLGELVRANADGIDLLNAIIDPRIRQSMGRALYAIYVLLSFQLQFGIIYIPNSKTYLATKEVLEQDYFKDTKLLLQDEFRFFDPPVGKKDISRDGEKLLQAILRNHATEAAMIKTIRDQMRENGGNMAYAELPMKRDDVVKMLGYEFENQRPLQMLVCKKFGAWLDAQHICHPKDRDVGRTFAAQEVARQFKQLLGSSDYPEKSRVILNPFNEMGGAPDDQPRVLEWLHTRVRKTAIDEEEDPADGRRGAAPSWRHEAADDGNKGRKPASHRLGEPSFRQSIHHRVGPRRDTSPRGDRRSSCGHGSRQRHPSRETRRESYASGRRDDRSDSRQSNKRTRRSTGGSSSGRPYTPEQREDRSLSPSPKRPAMSSSDETPRAGCSGAATEPCRVELHALHEKILETSDKHQQIYRSLLEQHKLDMQEKRKEVEQKDEALGKMEGELRLKHDDLQKQMVHCQKLLRMIMDFEKVKADSNLSGIMLLLQLQGADVKSCMKCMRERVECTHMTIQSRAPEDEADLKFHTTAADHIRGFEPLENSAISHALQAVAEQIEAAVDQGRAAPRVTEEVQQPTPGGEHTETPPGGHQIQVVTEIRAEDLTMPEPRDTQATYIVNEVYQHPIADPYLDEWDAANNRQ